jgi:stress-induced morphogen
MLRTCCRSLAYGQLRLALQRCYSAAVQAETDAEKSIAAKIEAGIKAQSISVADTSGGCGAMYSIEVVSEEFKGMSIVKQHQLVTKLLKEQIAEWHGFQLVTKAP